MSTNKDSANRGGTQPQGKTPVAANSSRAARPATGASATGSKPGTSAAGSRPGTRPTSSAQRGGAQIYNKGSRPINAKKGSTGKQFGPLDIAMLLGGVLIVGIVIYFGLNLGKSGTNSVTPGTGSSQAAVANPTVDPAQGANAGPTTTPDPSLVEHNITPVAEGRPAPDFNLPAADGKNYSLSQFLGKVVLVEFFAPWCPHCQADSTIMNQVYDKYKDKIQMLMVSAHPYGLGWEEGQSNPIQMSDITWFRDNFHIQYPMLLDKAVKAGDDYGIAYFPTIYIIGKDGTVFSRILAERGNAITVERVSGELDKALK